MKKLKTLAALILCCYMIITGAAWQKDDPYLFTARPGTIQGHAQRGDLFYIGYDKKELGGQIEVYKRDGTWQKTLGPLPIGHASEMDFADWNGYLYVSDGTPDYKSCVFEIDVSGEAPYIRRTITNPAWQYSGLVAIDNANQRILLTTTVATPGEVIFAYSDMEGNIEHEFRTKWIHVPQGIELLGDSIYYHLNTKLEILCARNGCRKMTYPLPYEGENQGMSLDAEGNVYVSYQSPPRIYNLGKVDEGECPCLSAHPGWYKWRGKWYHYDNELHMGKGWLKDGRSWYMLDEYTGRMQTGWQQLEWSGKTGWYYFNPSGSMATGWKQLNWNGKSCWFYFPGSGAMATGTQTINGARHSFDSNGVWIGQV